jgi:hypothetical protein
LVINEPECHFNKDSNDNINDEKNKDYSDYFFDENLIKVFSIFFTPQGQ